MVNASIEVLYVDLIEPITAQYRLTVLATGKSNRLQLIL